MKLEKIFPLGTLIISIIISFASLLCFSGCDDSKSYAELLTEENKAVNRFLANQRVINEIPADSTFAFEVGENAPYYRLDEDGNMYMQVIKRGTPGNYAETDQIIYFRYTRYNLNQYKDDTLPDGVGNVSDMGYSNAWFRYDNYSLQSSYQWGTGIQIPLKYLPIDCEVNIVIKSQYGFYEEMSYVIPFLFNIRYYPQMT